MLDLLGIASTAAVMVFMVGSIAVSLDASRAARLSAVALAGTWIGFAAAAAAAGWLVISRPFPVMGLFVAAPLIAASLACLSSRARLAMLSLPMRLLVGLNVGRTFAVLFLLLAAEGRLAGPFPYFAGWGDIITGTLAVPLALASGAEWKQSRLLSANLLRWNLFGISDLVVAVFLGVTSADGSPLQLFHFPPGSAAMQHPPFAFVPTVLVPFYLIIHGIVLAKLVSRDAIATT
jgi:hypothetical protein